MRKPESARPASGHVTHDEKGNAVWHLSRDGETPSARVKRLGLAVATDKHPVDAGKIKRVAAEFGFDPYDSGLVEKTKNPQRHDLRKLSQVTKLRKQRGKVTKP